MISSFINNFNSMKLIFLFLILIVIIIDFSFVNTLKYIIKKKQKIPEPNEWNIPQVPSMAFDVYPGVELHTLDQKYNEMISGEDIVQIETMVGKTLPMNAKLVASLTPQLISNANKK